MLTTLVLDKPLPLTSQSPLWSDLLQQLLSGQSLNIPQAADLMQGWLTEAIPPVLSGAILTALNVKGVSSEELFGMVQVLYAHCACPSFRHQLSVPLIDTCGTGGDRASTFNISTAVAFVAAAAGVKVAKHGNRSASSKTGSADVLEALGVNLNVSHDQIEAAINEIGITFLFAPEWHPALKNVSGMRRSLKIRTIFNLLGPLINPLQPTGQVIGVSDRRLIATFAQVLSKMSKRKAIILHSRERLDEAGLADVTDLSIVSNSQIETLELAPQALGISQAPTTALQGGDVQENAQILKAVLQGKGTPAQQDVVALNTALALVVGEAIPVVSNYLDTFSKGLTLAKDILRSGEPWHKLEQLVHLSQNHSNRGTQR